MQRTPLATAALAVMLLLGACSSDTNEQPGSFGRGQPTTTGDVDRQVPSPTAGSATLPPASSSSAPLTEPTVALSAIGSFDQPVDVAARPGDGTVYVAERPGRVLAVSDAGTDVVLDITDLTRARGEQGLLGLAFHPTADLAFVHFTDADGDNVVAEFRLDSETGRFDRDSLREVLTVDQPYSNHNGGQVAFGPDQFLYVSIGDGGSGGDPERHGLDLTTRLGKILRIDPAATGDAAFTIPDDNPFAEDPAADPAIWAYGLRNAWRFSFDADTGDLWIGDVGQDAFEEINRSSAVNGVDAGRGVNFGWSAFEGFERFNDDQPDDGAVPPLFVYGHGDGRCSVTGGTIARGDAVADLAGWYVFGDYCTGQVWALDPNAPPSDPRVVEIAQLDALVAIRPGPDGELYAVSDQGTVARLVGEM